MHGRTQVGHYGQVNYACLDNDQNGPGSEF